MKTHWKKLRNPDYLGSWDFQPDEVKKLTISKVIQESVYDPQSRQKESCSVCYFKQNVKPMILNTTNAKAIEKQAGSPYIEDWFGVNIFVKVEQIKAFGQEMDAVRVTKHPIKEGLTPTHKAWSKAKEAIKSGSVTIEQIRAKYNLSPENEKLLCSK